MSKGEVVDITQVEKRPLRVNLSEYSFYLSNDSADCATAFVICKLKIEKAHASDVVVQQAVEALCPGGVQEYADWCPAMRGVLTDAVLKQGSCGALGALLGGVAHPCGDLRRAAKSPRVCHAGAVAHERHDMAKQLHRQVRKLHRRTGQLHRRLGQLHARTGHHFSRDFGDARRTARAASPELDSVICDL